MTLSLPRQRALFLVLLGAALIAGIQHAVSLWYVNDDCFVSFRYARNLVDGLGLVYNAGERVEGYTNFLWTVVIAAGMKAGIDPVPFATGLGIVFHAATILLYGAVSWRLRAIGRPRLALIPLTSLALALHREMNAHATSGMETSMFSFLVSAAFALLLLRRSRAWTAGAGTLLVLAMMARPDGIIFLAGAAAALFASREDRAGRVAALLAPAFVLFLPYWLIRWIWYGFFFPNTFYAKSIDLPYLSQGMTYALLYFRTYYLFFVIPLLPLLFLVKGLRAGGGVAGAEGWYEHPLLLGYCFVVPYTLFVVRIGGDFMFARFFVATTPVMLFMIEYAIARLAGGRTGGALAAAVLCAVFFRADQYGARTMIGYIADESRYFTADGLARARQDGATLKRCFNGAPVRIAFWAGQLRMIYYAEPPYAIESSGGLTDTAVAHESVTVRGRPGHEKMPTTDYLMKRHVEFILGSLDAPPPSRDLLNAVVFGDLLGRILLYDNAVMEKLAGVPDVRFVRMPEFLDRYIARIDTLPQATIRRDYAFFRPYYFSCNADSARERPFIEALSR